MLAAYRSDPKLLMLADAVREERKDLKAYSMSYQGAYTDGAIGIKNVLPTLTFLGLDQSGWIPNVHQMSDVIENVDPASVARTVARGRSLETAGARTTSSASTSPSRPGARWST